jgi:hypothetical protein
MNDASMYLAQGTAAPRDLCVWQHCVQRCGGNSRNISRRAMRRRRTLDEDGDGGARGHRCSSSSDSHLRGDRADAGARPSEQTSEVERATPAHRLERAGEVPAGTEDERFDRGVRRAEYARDLAVAQLVPLERKSASRCRVGKAARAACTSAEMPSSVEDAPTRSAITSGSVETSELAWRRSASLRVRQTLRAIESSQAASAAGSTPRSSARCA